ncbi:hypothetical protein FSARC_6704 [Fusarium sarcochroum]|uniref:Ankyrin n=1 Tax=Fusarium sarcochroum TaxID=1208366 RepID=A0A8H4X921_9HYPO|nr:hypothetical protein FSARC_6704 [Fusarium sarcochroum]
MAEAVGLAASIAGLVQLTGSVFKLVTKFCKEAKDAPSKAQELATQARELAGILENLRLLATSLETRDPDCSLKTQYLDSCQQTLDGIHVKLEKAQDDFESGKSGKRFLRRLKWPFSLSDTKDLVADLANHRANLHLALSADSMDALLKSLTKQDEIHNMIERKLSFDTRVQLNKRRQEIIGFFLRVKPQDYLDVSHDLRHEATGSWLTSGDPTFAAWKNGYNSKLWLSGIPGSGKTVLCGLVIETVLKESDDSTAVCYAFCDYKNPDTCLPENIIAALAVQLGLQCEDAFDLLEEYFDILHPGDKLPAQPKLDELLELVQCLADAYDKVFVVVDGLDECGDHVSRMTQSLRSLVDRSEPISAAFFSRKEEEIREKLEDDFEHIEVSAHTKDLENYTLAEVSKRKVLKNVERTNPALYKDIIETLVQGAQGINNARKKALKELPPTLYGTYDRVLQRIMQCPTETQACIQRALQWIALGNPKMDITELCEAVSIRQGVEDITEDDFIDPDIISRRCGCLLLLEYLERSSVEQFRYSEQDAYQSYAETAARFLLFPCFDRVPTLSETIENAYCTERDSKHPFYRVAKNLPRDLARHESAQPAWPTILENKPIISLLKRLFGLERNGNFRAWSQACMASGVDITSVHQFSTNPLHIAAFFTSPKLCKFLLQQGADVNGVIDSQTPLSMAIGSIQLQTQNNSNFSTFWSDRYAEVLNILLDYGADVAFSDRGKSCLADAFEFLRGPSVVPFIRPSIAVPEDAISAFLDRNWDDDSDVQLLQSILEMCAKNDTPIQWQPMTTPALFHSRRRGLAVLGHTASIPTNNYSDADYPKALGVAIRPGLVEELSILIADSRFIDSTRGHSDIIFELLSAAAESTTHGGGKTIEMLLDCGLDPNTVDSSSQTCLHVSCESGNVDVARILLARGVDPACRDRRGQTPWHVAASNGHKDILMLLFQEDKSPLKCLAALDSDGQTPLCAALKDGHTEACLFLLKVCPSEPTYFQSSTPPLHYAAMSGSQEIFSAVLAKDAIGTATTEPESTPMHHLGASCTADFARYMRTMYDPLCLDASDASPFERFFRRWLFHNGDTEADKTIPLDGKLLRLLLPDNLEFSKNGRRTHVWEIICGTMGHGQGDLCCYPTSPLVLNDSNTTNGCDHYLSRDQDTIFKRGVLSSYESTRKRAGIEPLVKALAQRNWKHFCSQSIEALISQVIKASSTRVKFCDIDDSSRLLKKAISEDASVLVSKLIDYGADVNQQIPKILWSGGPTSLFEIACSEANLETFEAILAAVSPKILGNPGPTGQTPLELVVKGKSSDKVPIVQAICNKRTDSRLDILATPLIVYAAKSGEWNVVTCLAGIGDDIFAMDEDGWGVAQYAVADDDLNMLKWVIESASEYSQWRTNCEHSWKTKEDAAWQQKLSDAQMSLLHMASDNPTILKYFLDHHLFADVNITTQCGRTPLHYAGFRGSKTCCQILLDSGANLSVRDSSGKLPIEYALDSGCTDIVSLLLEAGSPFPHEQPPGVSNIDRNISSNKGLELVQRDYFEKAILAGNLEQCKLAVRRGCLIDRPLRSCRRCTPLFAAIRSKQENIINWLLEQGASTLGVDCDHNFHSDIVVHAVSVLDSPSCMSRVLSAAFHHRTIWHTTLTDSIYLAVERDKAEMLESILTHFKQNIEHYHNAWGFSLYDDLGINSIQEFESAIVNQPAGLKGSNKRTPLHCAAKSGSLVMVRMLIHHGAKVDSKDKTQATALILAALDYHLTVAKELLAHGASVEPRNLGDQTAMACAVSNGDLDMVKLLELASPLSFQFMTVDGSNLLSIEITGELEVETFKYLVSKGVELWHFNRNGDSMLNLVLEYDYARDYLLQSRLTIPSPVYKRRIPSNPWACAAFSCRPNVIKRVFLSLPPTIAKILIDQEDKFYGTPLCATATSGSVETGKALLVLGANIEQDGSSFGTPVMDKAGVYR